MFENHAIFFKNRLRDIGYLNDCLRCNMVMKLFIHGHDILHPLVFLLLGVEINNVITSEILLFY